MKSFIARHISKIKGVLSGFDRIRFRGTLRLLANPAGLRKWMGGANVLLKDFSQTAMQMTDAIKLATEQVAAEAGRPVQYLPSSSLRKEDLARQIAARDQITEGLVCVLTSVEPCHTFTVGPNRQTKKLELRTHSGKCLHQYFYLIDPHWGWLNVRLQTWFPFNVHIVINGREWLSQLLREKGIGFERRDNCFVEIEDLAAAQRLMNGQLQTPWADHLNRLLRQVHPTHATMFPQPLDHYWSADETEWASDVMYRSEADLAALYPSLIRHAMTQFGCHDVMRFLGKRPIVRLAGEVESTSHLGRRVEGVRVRHTHNRNSVKMYDKQQLVLRVETTINNTRGMKVYRAAENDPKGPKKNRILRKGVADLHRRAEISQKTNDRYLESFAEVESDETTLANATESLCRRTEYKARPVRALNPLAKDDAELLEAINRGEFVLQGFRNRDLCALLFAKDSSLTDRQKMTKVTRLLRLLRAHKLIQKVPKTHRYLVSPHGRQKITALLTAREANTRKLNELAA